MTYCDEFVTLEAFGLTVDHTAELKPHTRCPLEARHPGPHVMYMHGPRFGQIARLEWFDAFPEPQGSGLSRNGDS